jgi:hypothetical protein
MNRVNQKCSVCFHPPSRGAKSVLGFVEARDGFQLV